MRAADEATISSGVPSETLMERAGRAVARAAVRQTGGRYGRRAEVVCGRGNNGGDGFVAARELARAGLAVRCLVVGGLDGITGAAGEHLERTARVVEVLPWEVAGNGPCDVVVDALFGTGFRGRAEGDAASAIEAMNEAGAPVVAVDIPSGVHGDTGAVDGPAVAARTTVVMAAEKLGTAVGQGSSLAGAVEVADIGIAVPEPHAGMIERGDVADRLPRRSADSHKRSRGAVALLGGSAGMSGAVKLAARSALRMGAGYCTVGATHSVDAALSAALPEILTTVVTEGDVLDAEAVDRFSGVIERATALAIGPGLGTGPAQRAMMAAVLNNVELPMVIDADGLNVLAGHSNGLASRTGPTVLTPHPAEMARLIDLSVPEVQGDRVGAARAAAGRFGCAVVLKGHRSVIAEPSGRVAVNPTGGPELASAGTGDVLTGAVAALLAAGLGPFEAAWCAVWVHGVAGTEAARRIGGPGVLAWDVAEGLPAAVTKTLEGSEPQG
ncbi:MAG: NAD(P)H-hydrate dehydratase [Actinomycetota bacterium]|nr:NAD(P)H-hydrate dehydratase [Actinomycetota bacterium]